MSRRAPEYSQYKLCVCSHMRLVAFGRQGTAQAHDEGGPDGWFHIAPNGLLENFGEPCQASIHRIDFEWPDDCTSINHMLPRPPSAGDEFPPPVPSGTTIAEDCGD